MNISLVVFALFCTTTAFSTASQNFFDETFVRTTRNFTSILLEHVRNSQISIEHCIPLIEPINNPPLTVTYPKQKKSTTSTYSHLWDAFDLQCREFDECNREKNAELNHTNDMSHEPIRHCECEHNFLDYIHKELNHPLYNPNKMRSLVGITYTMNTRTCYDVEHPIIKCLQYQNFFSYRTKCDEYPNGFGTQGIRCVKYALDYNQPKNTKFSICQWILKDFIAILSITSCNLGLKQWFVRSCQKDWISVSLN